MAAVALAVALTVAALVHDPAAPAYASKTLLLLIVSIGAAAIALARGGIQLGTAGWAWCLLTAWLAVSLGWAEHAAPLALAPFVIAALVAAAAAPLGAQGARATASRVGFWLATVSSAAAWWQHLSGARGIAVHGLHGNPNWLGLVLAAAVPLAIEHARANRGAARVGAYAALALVTSGLLLAGSRTALAALAIAAVAWSRGRARVLVTGGAICAGVLVAFGGGAGASLAGRGWLWRAAARAWTEAPIVGQGLGDLPFALLDAQGELLAPLAPEIAARKFAHADSAHGDWLELLATGGPLAPLLLLVVLALVIVATRRTWRAGAATATVLGLMAIADTPLWQPAIAPLIGLLLAGVGLQSGSRWRAGIVLVMAVALGPGAARGWVTARSLTAAEALPLEERVARLGAIAAADPASGEAAFAAGEGWLELGDTERALPLLERARRELARVGVDIAIGNAELARGEPARAIAAYRRALARHPGSFRAHANLAEAARTAGDLDTAERHLALAQRLQPHHPKLTRMAERLRRARIDATTR